jgi:hypothetical protein
MPHHFAFDEKNRVLLTTLEGHITEAEFEEFYNIVPLYAARMKPLGGIIDFSGVTRLDVRMEKVRSFAFAPPALRNSNLPRVIVAPDPAVYGLARMFQTLSEQTRPLLYVVHSMKEAYEELRLENARFEPLGPLETE